MNDDLLLVLAGTLAGVAVGLLAAEARDFPWLVRILWRFARYRERPRPGDYPPSVRPYLEARSQKS